MIPNHENLPQKKNESSISTIKGKGKKKNTTKEEEEEHKLVHSTNEYTTTTAATIIRAVFLPLLQAVRPFLKAGELCARGRKERQRRCVVQCFYVLYPSFILFLPFLPTLFFYVLYFVCTIPV
jgi:hypothetical protein